MSAGRDKAESAVRNRMNHFSITTSSLQSSGAAIPRRVR